jgi:serine/threonine-protein kinase
MGVVYQAQHVHLGRTVALKLLAPELSESEDFRARFLRESRLAATLDHPGIVTIYDAGDVNGVLYLAMRFVRGTDLSAVLTQRGPLSASESLAILEQVAAALDAAHAAQLVHRDVKPANVMIEGQRCYLTDFGLTKRASSDSAQLTAAGQFLGTVDYVAPEQIEGREVDGRADEYALGCVMFECLTGSRPYPRDSQVAILFAQLRDPPPRACELRPDLPEAIDAVIDRAMAKAPADRYATCGEMVAAAREALAAPAAPTVPVEVDLPPAPPVTAQPATAPLPDEPSTAPLPPVATPLATAAAAAAAAPAQYAAPPPVDPPTAQLQPSPLPPQPAAPPASTPARRRSPWPFVAAAALGLAVIAAVVVLAGGSGGNDQNSSPAEQAASPAPTPGPSETPAAPEARADKPGGPRVAGDPIPVGGSPTGIVFREGALWVANTSENTVTKVTPADGETVSIPVGGAPFDMASNRSSVWAANTDGNSVTRIGLDTGEAGPEIPVGKRPYFLTAENDFVYVSNGGSDSVTVLDAETGQQVGEEIPVGDEPRGISTDADVVWVANSGEGSVTQIVDGQPRETIMTGAGAANIAAKEGVIWVANEDAGTVSRIEPSGSAVEVTSAPVGQAPLAIVSGEGYAWVAVSGEDKVVQLDLDSGKPTGQSVPIPGRPTGLTLTDDGGIWVTAGDAGTVTRIEP